MQRPVLGGLIASLFVANTLSSVAPVCGSTLNLGPEQVLQAGGSDLAVSGYSVPQYYDWDNDGLYDLIVGEGGAGSPGMVRVYLNHGTTDAPLWTDYQMVQSMGDDLLVGANGCLGAFPRVTNFDGDGKKDLLLGLADGRIQVYLNTGTDDAPTFDDGQPVRFGPEGAKTDIDVGYRATLDVVDWNNDGLDDLVTGGFDGQIRLYVNEGTPEAPEFLSETIVQTGGSQLKVPGDRSSPVVMDVDGDGMKDLLVGNTTGQILLYSNQGTDASPIFSDFSYVTSEGVQIDLPDTPRSRPYVTDWTGDGLLDLLVGSGDGTVRLYEGQSDPSAVALQAGDANRDLAFDQLDLLLVLRGGKYRSEQPATWGEGDWNGAPGGNPDHPPEGDGRFDHLDIMAALKAGYWLAGPYGAQTVRAGLDRVAPSLGYNAVLGGDSAGAHLAHLPEPSTCVLGVLAMLALASMRGQPRGLVSGQTARGQH